MGDIVSSENDPAIERLHEAFNAAVDRRNREQRDILASPLTITLGDEFQGLATSLPETAALVRAMRLELLEKTIDCRFAIGIARLGTPLNTERAWNMMGPGLGRTRERLNEKRADTLYRFVFPDFPAMESMLEALGAGLTAIERRWTGRQLSDILASLSGESAAAIARRRNVSAHTVYKVRASGEFDLYAGHWRAIGEALAFLGEEYGLS